MLQKAEDIKDPTVPSKSLNGNQNPIKYGNKDVVIENLSLPTLYNNGSKIKYTITKLH